MGGQISVESAVAEHPGIKRLCGSDSVSSIDPLWNQLFSFNLEIDDTRLSELAKFADGLDNVQQSLLHNTSTTDNLASLVKVLLKRMGEELLESEKCGNKIFVWQTANGLCVLRHILQYQLPRVTESQLIRLLHGNDQNTSDESDVSSAESDDGDGERRENGHALSTIPSRVEKLVDALVDVVLHLPVNPTTLALHLESVRCLLLLSSGQLYRESLEPNSAIFRMLLLSHIHDGPARLCGALLSNYLTHNTEFRPAKSKQSESIVLGIASSMWSMMSSVVSGAGVNSNDSDEADDVQAAPTLGNLSLILLLTLVCHPTTEPILVGRPHPNPYKHALAVFKNAQEVSTELASNSGLAMDYGALYNRLCATAEQEPPMMLLYQLLHSNLGFRNYTLARINIENLVVPVTRVLQNGVEQPRPSGQQHHTYLALIVLLILSEDDFFCRLVHETTVSDVDWCEGGDRAVGNISLGSLLVVVFSRAIQRNAAKGRDRYLHTHCLAVLANMASTFKQLASVAAQRLVALLEVLARRHTRLVAQMREHAAVTLGQKDGTAVTDFHAELVVVEEGVRTVLEILNAALSHNLRHNANLVYALLHRRALFDDFKAHPMFQDLLQNLSLVIAHFSSRLLALDTKSASVPEMLTAIERAAVQWPTDRLVKFPDLKFRYVEDENTTDFFVPYAWKLAVLQSALHWQPARIRLFNALQF